MIDIKPPATRSPETVWAYEQLQALAQKIYELEEKIKEMQNASGNS